MISRVSLASYMMNVCLILNIFIDLFCTELGTQGILYPRTVLDVWIHTSHQRYRCVLYGRTTLATTWRRPCGMDFYTHGIEHIHEFVAKFQISASELHLVWYTLSVELENLGFYWHPVAAHCYSCMASCPLRRSTRMLCPQITRTRLGDCRVDGTERYVPLLSFSSLVCRMVDRHARQFRYLVESGHPGVVLGSLRQWNCRLRTRSRLDVRLHALLGRTK